MQQMVNNTQMKHLSNILLTKALKNHANTGKVCFNIGRFYSMFSTFQIKTIFFCILNKKKSKRPDSKLIKMTYTNLSILCRLTTTTTWKCTRDSFGPVFQLWSVTSECMHDNKPQRCVQQQKMLKSTPKNTKKINT